MDYESIGMRTIIAWLLTYLLVCGLIPVAVGKLFWEATPAGRSAWLNLITLFVFNILFLLGLKKKYRLKLDIFRNLSFKGIVMALACSLLFFLLLDKFLDPFFDCLFRASAEGYQRTIEQLRQAPVVSFIRVCLLAPVVEEILIRGWVLTALYENYPIWPALLLSTFFFAVLHFNFVQTLSAVIAGLILGLLYIKTGSLFCCILAHALYNTISYFNIIF